MFAEEPERSEAFKNDKDGYVGLYKCPGISDVLEQSLTRQTMPTGTILSNKLKI